MYKNQKIIYGNHPITNLEDFKQLICNKNNQSNYSPDILFSFHVSTTNSAVKTTLSNLLKEETILFQQAHLYTPNPPFLFQRNYSFQNMLKTQEILEILDLVESIKYAGNYTNARKLLQWYLHSKYNFPACHLLKKPKNNKLSVRTIWALNDLNLYNDNLISTVEEVNQPSPSKSIRQHLTYFLSSIINSNNLYQYCGLFTKTEMLQNNDSSQIQESKERFYLPAYEIPLFLLLFTYFDGRNFENIDSQQNPDKLPRYKRKQSYSKFSYSLVLEKLQQLRSTLSTDSLLDISTFICCDNIFLYSKLNCLTYYYNLYLDEPMLTAIIQKYSFSYSQVTGLKQFLIDNIFMDEIFILLGLRSNYIDFMLPFDILFRSSILIKPVFGEQRSFSSFQSELERIKRLTLSLYTDIFCTHNPEIFSFTGSGNFSISNTEKNISEYLINDAFFKNCYCSNDLFMQHFMASDSKFEGYFYKFRNIKKALNIPEL